MVAPWPSTFVRRQPTDGPTSSQYSVGAAKTRPGAGASCSSAPVPKTPRLPQCCLTTARPCTKRSAAPPFRPDSSPMWTTSPQAGLESNRERACPACAAARPWHACSAKTLPHLVDHLLRGRQPAPAHGRRLGSTPWRRRLRPPSRCNGRRGPPGRRSRPSSRARVRFLPLHRHKSNVRRRRLRRGRPHRTDTTSHEAVTPRTSPAIERSVACPEPPPALSAESAICVGLSRPCTANPLLIHGFRLPGQGGTSWTVRDTKPQLRATGANPAELPGRWRCGYGSEGWGFEFLRAR